MSPFRKRQPGFEMTWDMLAQMAVDGHESILLESVAGNDDQRFQEGRRISRAVLAEIGGIDQFASGMKRLSEGALEGADLDEELFQSSGYNAARARLFPDGRARSKRATRFGIWRCPSCSREFTRLNTPEDTCPDCGSALEDIRPSARGL